MLKISEYDLYRYDGCENFFKGYIKNSGFRFTYFFRKCQNTKGILYLINKIILRILSGRYGYEISEKTLIGKGLAIMHRGGIAINHKAVIGENVTIYHGVTIGGDVGRKEGAPTIGNFVWIGPNAVIVGKIKLGSNILIAGNSYINFDVPDNSLVLGNPGKIYKFDRIREYISYVKEEKNAKNNNSNTCI